MTVSSLAARDLRKVYSGRSVVQGVSIEIRPGEVVGLLGPNGAGKTTTFYMVVGLVPPDGGRVILGDEDNPIAENRRMAVVADHGDVLVKLARPRTESL